MASQVTDWGRGRLLAIVLGHSAQPVGLWVALCAGEPGTAIDGTALAGLEPDRDAGYARRYLPMGVDFWSDPADGYSATTVPIPFGVPTGPWGSVAYYALCTAAFDGQVYCYGEFDVPTQPGPVFDVLIPAGALVLQVSSLDATIVAG